MRMNTLAEQFAPFLAGRYRGSPGLLWRQLERSWNASEILDVTMVGDGDLQEAIEEAITSRDSERLTSLCGQAEAAGVHPQMCQLTREALRVQYQPV